MISKKSSTMLSQLPLASPVVPGERGRHLHRYRRQVAGRGGCVVHPTAGARLARCPYSLLTPSSGPYFWEWSHAGPPSSRTPWSTCLILKDVRRATCPLDAPNVPVNAAGGSYGNWASPRFFRRPRAAGTIGRRSMLAAHSIYGVAMGGCSSVGCDRDLDRGWSQSLVGRQASPRGYGGHGELGGVTSADRGHHAEGSDAPCPCGGSLCPAKAGVHRRVRVRSLVPPPQCWRLACYRGHLEPPRFPSREHAC